MKKVLSLLLAAMLLFALAVPAMPAEFVPSISVNEAPGVIQMTDSEGNACDALMVDEEGNETAIGEGTTIELVATGIGNTDEAPSEEIAEALEEAFEELLEAESLADLVPEIKTLMAGVEAEPEDLVITQVFDLSLVDENGDPIVIPAGVTVTCKVKSTLKADDIFFVLHQMADGNWEVVDSYLDENGVLTLRVTGMSPFAVVKVGEIALEPGTGTGTGSEPGTGTIPPSPQTGDSFPVVYLACALLCVCAAVVLFKKAGKKAE